MISPYLIAALPSLIGLVSAVPTTQCTVSTLTSFEAVNGSVAIDTSPLAPLQGADVANQNGSAFEEWYWDLISPVRSANGTDIAGLTITIERGPLLADYGYGNLFIEVAAAFPNGTQYLSVDFSAESTVSVCEDGKTTGTWTSLEGDGEFVKFVTSNASKEAVITFNTSAIQGTYTLSSFTLPHTPDGLTYPNSAASVELSPFIYWVEPVSAGVASADLVLGGTPFKMTGYGGNDHAWATAGYSALSHSTRFVRVVAGPYVMVYWTFDSIVEGQTGTYTSAYIIERDEQTPIFATGPFESSETLKEKGLAVNFTLTYGGKVSGSFSDDTSTGYIATFTEDAGRSWKFIVEHANIVMQEAWTEDYSDGVSLLVDTATGGEVGCDIHSGVGLTEQNQYPAA